MWKNSLWISSLIVGEVLSIEESITRYSLVCLALLLVLIALFVCIAVIVVDDDDNNVT